MKQLMRRLSRVYDSSSPPSPSPSTQNQQLLSPLLLRHRHRSSKSQSPDDSWMRDVPEGHLPVYVGEEMRRFVVRADMLSRPALAELLRRSAQEYGYDQRGVLRIPCPAAFFQRVLEEVRAGRDIGLMDDEGWNAAFEVPPSPTEMDDEEEEYACC